MLIDKFEPRIQDENEGRVVVDQQVLNVQVWLNQTYGVKYGWVTLDEDGQTGWQTIYGLRRALQVELGITTLSSGFGPSTTSAYESLIGTITANSNTSAKILRILSGALFCKGYRGFYPGEAVEFSILQPALATIVDLLGIAARGTGVDVKLMKSLLSMDAYAPVWGGNGRGAVVTVQQWLNGQYLHRRDFNVIPTDGIFSRQALDALLYAVQFEIGIADGVANGNFGPGTKTGLQQLAFIQEGNADSSKNFVRLFQACLIVNHLDVPLSGVFDSATKTKVLEFQTFLELFETGEGNYSTWCALLVSNGDETIATKGMDTNVQLASAQATAVKSAGYTHVGRYVTGPSKFISIPEIKNLKNAEFQLFPISQVYNNNIGLLNYGEGKRQGNTALLRAYILGLPTESTVYFAVDFDPTEQGIRGNVVDFFRGIQASVNSAHRYRLTVAVYGTRNVCQVLIDEDLAEGAFVAGASYKFSGNMGFPMPSKWHYNQIATDLQLPGGSPSQGLDKVVVSRNAHSVDCVSLVPPPVHQDPNLTTELGFDLVYSWVAQLEIRAEQLIVEDSSPIVAPSLPRILSLNGALLHLLRTDKYWSAGWKIYTPNMDITPEWQGALTKVELALTEFPRVENNYDISHFSAVLIAYRTWDLVYVDHPSVFSLGDIGGWLFDLVSMYETYLNDGPQTSVQAYVAATMGTLVESKFDWWDLLADADAWLFYRTSPVGRTLSAQLRVLWAREPMERVTEFFEAKFDSSLSNINAQLTLLHDSLGAGDVINGYPTVEALKLLGLNFVPPLVVFQELAAGFHTAMLGIVANEA